MKTDILRQNIPNRWQEKRLGDLVCITTGKRDANHGSSDGQYPFFTCAQKISKIDNFAFDTEAVLIAGNGDFNVKYYKGKFDAYQRTYILSDFKDTTGSFVYQKVKQALNEIIKNNQGSSVRFIKMGDLTDYPLLLPPLEEQQKIAEILGAVDEDIAKTQELIDTTEKLKRGLMQELFTIGDKKEIKEIAELNPKQINPLNKPNEEFYYVDIASVKENVITGVKMFFGKDAPSRARRVLAYKDIIISTVRPNLRGFAYISKEYDTYLGSTGFCVLRSDDNKVDSKFLYYIIANNNFTDYLVGKTTGSNYPAVNPKDIGEYICAVPSLDKQKEIADILSSIDKKISFNKKLKEKLITLKKGLMQDLLSGRVRVNIN